MHAQFCLGTLNTEVVLLGIKLFGRQNKQKPQRHGYSMILTYINGNVANLKLFFKNNNNIHVKHSTASNIQD